VGVLAPVKPGLENHLVAHLAALPKDHSPFEALQDTHIARLTVVGQVRPFQGLPRSRRRLRMRYLLFTAVTNQPAPEFFEELRVSCSATVEGVWEHCVQYPGCKDPSRFLRYMTLNLVPALQTFEAYDASVHEIRVALDLRSRHRDLALDSQGMSPRQLLQAFTTTFAVAGKVDQP
jgi:hypothetical protein